MSLNNSETKLLLHNKPLHETRWKWLTLLLINISVFGDFFAVDNPQPLEHHIKEILKVDERHYSLLYTTYAFPSIITPLFGGLLIDRIGIRKGFVLFSLIVLIGQSVYTYGGYQTNLGWMLIGRVIYSLGSDPLNVAQTVFTNKWFKGGKVGFAMGLGNTTYALCRGLNSIVVPKIYNMYKTLFAPMLFSVFICAISVVAVIFTIILDRMNDASKRGADMEDSNVYVREDRVRLRDVRDFKPIVWLLITNFALVTGLNV